MPTRNEYLDTFHRDAELFEAAVRAGGDLTAPIDGCDDWDLAGLVEHVGTLHRNIVAGVALGEFPTPASGPPAGTDAADWFAEGAAAMEAMLRSKPDDEECWTFFSNAPKTIGTWVRRQCQELSVHRYDAEMAATGTAEVIDPALAKDGIDEYFDLFVERVDKRTPIRIGEATLHLHATDAEGEWFVRCGDHAPQITREHAKGDVALSGSANDLLLTIWGRVTPDEVDIEVFGDPDVWARFQAAASI